MNTRVARLNQILLTAVRRLGLPLLAAVLVAQSVVTAYAGTQGGWRYFPETGCWVGNEFLDFYDRRGGLDIFGYPIQNAGSENGVTVQYFQRARMELRPDQPEAYRVQLGLLGLELRGYVDPAVPQRQLPTPGDRTRQYFAETGQVVGGAFLEFFRTRGGLDIFGYPISGEATEGNTTVQYFQRARMEWRPNNPVKYRVELGLLGQESYQLRYGPGAPQPAALTPVPGLTAPTPTPTAVTTPPKTGGPPPAVGTTPGVAPTATPSPESSSSVVLTWSHLIMFTVTFVVVVLVGVTLLWRRGALREWLNRRGGPGTGQDWRSGA